MPFRIKNFREAVEGTVKGPVGKKLLRACDDFMQITTPRKKLLGIQNLMNILDESLHWKTRRELMQSCGRRCICDSTLKMAVRLQKKAKDLDELLELMNQSHIGGGHLRLEGNTIHAEYHRCYCGSVSNTEIPFSSTYCHCSCGWYRQLFETVLKKPVTVELLGSIIQGDDRCRFLIHI